MHQADVGEDVRLPCSCGSSSEPGPWCHGYISSQQRNVVSTGIFRDGANWTGTTYHVCVAQIRRKRSGGVCGVHMSILAMVCTPL